MQCSPAEIERKRQEALKKLASKKKSPLRIQNLPVIGNVPPTTSPNPKFKFTKSFPAASNKTHNVKPYDRGNTKSTPVSQFYSKESTVTAKCILQSESRFIVELSAFSTPAIEVFKTIPSRNYDTKERLWSFDIKDYEILASRINGLKGLLELSGLPKYVLSCVRSPKRDLSIIDLSQVEPELRDSLMPFQRNGVAYGIDKGGRCLIADDMGLGKTLQALGIASYYREDWPLLIITTASMKNAWEQTIIKYIPSLPLMQLQYMVTTKDFIGGVRVLIVSHDMFLKFGVVIVDESQNLKNFKNKGTQAAAKIAKLAKRVILLSGTPALSRPSELYSLFFIDSKFFPNFFEYSKRYCDGKTSHFGWDSSGQSNLQELQIILARHFMIRRTKDEVLATLPNKNQEIITLDVGLNQLSKEDRSCLESLANKFHSKKGRESHAALLSFFSETARIKIPSVLSYILHVLQENKKFLVFAHHQVMLDAITQILTKKGKKFMRIDGSTATLQRQYFVDQFQTDDDCICAVLSITAANAGITLTAAELVVFAELHWNPSILSQAESRAHRIGQDKAVTVRYLLAPGTADDSIWPMLKKKQKILSEAGLFKESFSNVETKNQPISLETTHRKFFPNFFEYSKRYCDGKTSHFGWDSSGQSNLQELQIILARHFMIRRTKDEVLATLPNKNQEIITLDVGLNQLSKEDRSCLESLANKFHSNKGRESHAALLSFFSETARIKIPSVLSYILHVLQENKKFLVFAHHQVMLDAITQILTKKGKKFMRIDGSTPTLQRQYFVDQFQTDDDCICAMLSITAANAGKTLTAAELVVFAELHWNPSILSQAESRAHRIGQDKAVTVRYLLAPGTADDSIWPMLKKKQKILSEAGLFKESFSNVETKNQPISLETLLTEGIECKTSHNTLDISTYFESPSEKQKINDSVVSDLIDSLFDDCPNISQNVRTSKVENSCDNGFKSELNVYDMLNDGFNDILCSIDI